MAKGNYSKIRSETGEDKDLPGTWNTLEQMLNAGLELLGDILYKDGIEQPYSELLRLRPEQILILTKYYKVYEFKLLDTAKALPLKCFNGVFYDEDDNVLEELEVEEMVQKINRSLDHNKIKNVVEIAKKYKAIDKIPEFTIAKFIKRAEKARQARLECDWDFRDEKFEMDFRFPEIAYQYIKALLYGDHKVDSYIFTIMSEGGKGKSTFTNFLKCLFKNETHSAIAKLINRFSLADFAGARLVIFNETTAHYLEHADIFKSITGGDTQSIERKGEQAINGIMNAKILMVGNELPSYDVTDTGLARRFINLPWEHEPIPCKDKPKNYDWARHEWTDEELLYQLLLVDEVEEMDYEALQYVTIKEALKTKSAFKYEFYAKYEDEETGNKYGEAKFYAYWKLLRKFFTEQEWDTEQALIKEKRITSTWRSK